MAGGRRCFVSLDILPQDGVVTYVSCESYLRGLKAVQQFRDLCIAAGDETREISAVCRAPRRHHVHASSRPRHRHHSPRSLGGAVALFSLLLTA